MKSLSLVFPRTLNNIQLNWNGIETPVEQRMPSPEIPRVAYTSEEIKRIVEIHNSLPSVAKFVKLFPVLVNENQVYAGSVSFLI